jgi:hypothetical protein
MHGTKIKIKITNAFRLVLRAASHTVYGQLLLTVTSHSYFSHGLGKLLLSYFSQFTVSYFSHGLGKLLLSYFSQFEASYFSHCLGQLLLTQLLLTITSQTVYGQLLLTLFRSVTSHTVTSYSYFSHGLG